jgi:hypothetical protein
MKSTALFLVLLPTCALAAPALLRSTRADLDGDGKAEPLSFQSTNKEGGFALKAGGFELKGQVGTPAKGFRVVDLDASDTQREVLVAGHGPNGREVYALYRLEREGWKQLPLPECTPVIKGNGLLLCDSWMGFWERRETYTYDGRAGTFTHVPQDLYWVGKPYKVASTAPLHRSREDAQVVASLKPGSTVTFVAFWAGAGDSDWYLLRSETGVLGWARLSELQEHLVGLVQAG